MGSQIKLKNNLQTELKIEHSDNYSALDITTADFSKLKASAYVVDTVTNMEAIASPYDGAVCIVKASGAGGIYVYDVDTWTSRITW